MNKKNLSFPLIIIAVVLGVVVFKHFNFKTLTFKQPWVDFLYLITFIITLFFLFKNKKSNNNVK